MHANPECQVRTFTRQSECVAWLMIASGQPQERSRRKETPPFGGGAIPFLECGTGPASQDIRPAIPQGTAIGIIARANRREPVPGIQHVIPTLQSKIPIFG